MNSRKPGNGSGLKSILRLKDALLKEDTAMQSDPPFALPVKALVFDAYGTLFDVHSVASLLNEVFPGQGTEISRVWRTKQLEYTWLLSLMGRFEDFWKVTARALEFACRALNLDCPASRQEELLNAYLRLEAFPDVKEGLKHLSAYPLAILSNGSAQMLAAAVASAGLKGVFTHVISVDEVKIFKPSPRVYALAPQKLGIELPAVAFVSANSWDVQGAGAFGLQTCWLNRIGQVSDELGFPPVVVVKQLTELADIIAS
jgi:2-haloacid dehalogenase